MKRIIRFYISHEISYGVAMSQIFNWSTCLFEKGIETEHLIFYTDHSKLLSMLRDSNQKVRRIRSTVKPVFRDITYFLTLFVILLRCNWGKDKIILQTRNNGVAIALGLLKLFFDFKIIYEIRGFGENTVTVETLSGRLKQRIREKRDKKLIRLADKVFCVSNEMRRVIIKTYSLSGFESKFVVFPGASSLKDFYSDERIRSIVRKQHNIGDKTLVILYSGNLDQPWQVPDQIFRFFQFIEESVDARLFVLTPNLELVQRYIKKYKINNENVFYKNCAYNELNKYYNAADYGILLRENRLLNRVASPTKFSEYILSGLPVIITDSVVDYAKFVSMYNIGFVIDSSVLEAEGIQEFKELLSNNLKTSDMKITDNQTRTEISRLGQTRLSKESLIDYQSSIITSI